MRDRSLIPLQLILALLAIIEGIDGISKLFHNASGGQVHQYAHLGSYALAYSSALLVIACRPARARGLLFIVTAAAIGFITTSILDILRNRAEVIGEINHVTKLIAPVVVWIIASRVIYFSRPKRDHVD